MLHTEFVDMNLTWRPYSGRFATTTARTGVLAPPVSSCVGPMLSLLRAIASHVGPCWVYAGPMSLGLYMLGHVEPKFGNLADFRSFKKRWKNTGILSAKKGPRPS